MCGVPAAALWWLRWFTGCRWDSGALRRCIRRTGRSTHSLQQTHTHTHTANFNTRNTQPIPNEARDRSVTGDRRGQRKMSLSSGRRQASSASSSTMRRASVRLEDDGEEAGRGGYTADLGEGPHHRAARGGVAIGALGGVASAVAGARRPQAPGRAWLLHRQEHGGGGGGPALLFLLRAVRREGQHDAVAQHVFVLHALAGALGCLGAGEPQHGAAARHAQHLPSTVSGEPLQTVGHRFGVAVRGEAVHKQKAETGLRSRHTNSTLGDLRWCRSSASSPQLSTTSIKTSERGVSFTITL